MNGNKLGRMAEHRGRSGPVVDRPKAGKRIRSASVRNAFKTLIWPRRGILAVGLLLIGMSQAAAFVLPLSGKYFIDDVLGKGEPLTPILLAIGAATFVQATASFSLTRLLSVRAHRLIADLRIRLQQHISRLPTGYFDHHPSGTLVSRIMSDVEGVRNLVGTGLVQLIGGILRSVVALLLLLRIDAGLTLFALVPLVLFGLMMSKAFAYIRPIFRKRHAIHAEVTGRLTETLGGIRVVKGFNAEEAEDRVFADGAGRLFANVKRSLTATALLSSSTTLLIGVITIVIMAISSQRLAANAITPGELGSFVGLLALLAMPILQMSNIGTQITEAFAGLDRMDEVLAETMEGESEERTVTLDDVEGAIRFENVSFSYDDETEVLHEISFEAEPGSTIALVGSSGSGKTTIAGLAASFLEPTRGRVLVDGVDMKRVRLDSFRQRLGVVLQDDFLFAGTIRENILFARPNASEDDVARAVAAAYVDEFTDRFEEGLETIIGERGVKLSGGQRQRVAIARAMLANPRVLILDEATSNLDAVSESLVQRSFETLLQGRTTFVIAHRLSTIRRADTILVVEDGRIVERGTHNELMQAEGRYHELYTSQARI